MGLSPFYSLSDNNIGESGTASLGEGLLKNTSLSALKLMYRMLYCDLGLCDVI